MGKAQEKTNDTLFEGMDKLRYAEIPISLTSILKAYTKQEKLWVEYQTVSQLFLQGKIQNKKESTFKKFHPFWNVITLVTSLTTVDPKPDTGLVLRNNLVKETPCAFFHLSKAK